MGRTGRVYVLEEGDAGLDGGMASILRVRVLGDPVGTSVAPAGTRLALKLSRADEKLSTEALGREVETFVALSAAPLPPCPRLHDVIGEPPKGLVLEWCPTDMERWWVDHHHAPQSFVELCEALADICRRIKEFGAVSEAALGRRVVHADIKPRNLLLSADNRWLLTDFGAAKSRAVEDPNWVATRMILGTENYIAPEALFNARKPYPTALDTWSVACTFVAMLKMRIFLLTGGRMPRNGTHAHQFRTARVALVSDLQQRKPELFVDRELDPAHFNSPEALPEKDQVALRDALAGVFNRPAARAEAALADDVLRLCDRALQIAPERRYLDPLEMAAAFAALAERWRELEVGLGSADDTATMMGLPEDFTGVFTRPRPPVTPIAVGRGEGASIMTVPGAPASYGAGVPGVAAAPGDAGDRIAGDGGNRVSVSREGAAASDGLGAPLSVDGGDRASVSAERGAGAVAATDSAPVDRAFETTRVEAASRPVDDARPPALPAADPAPRTPAVVPTPAGRPPIVTPPARNFATTARASHDPPPPPPAVSRSAPLPTGYSTSWRAPARFPPWFGIALATVVALQVVQIGLSLTGLALDARRDAARVAPAPVAQVLRADVPAPVAPVPSPSPAASLPTLGPAAGEGLVLVAGAQAFLTQGGKRISVGTVPPGSYELFAQVGADGGFQSQGAFQVAGGERLVFQCEAGACQRRP